jgi:hypothetical protein
LLLLLILCFLSLAMSATTTNNKPVKYVTELRASDVLFGRGSGPNDHEGNVNFRHLVAERKSEYMATNHRLTKAKIAREVIDSVMHENGRFLKKVEVGDAESLGLPPGVVDAWIEVDDDTVMEKAKQALRQNSTKGKQDESFGGKPSTTCNNPQQPSSVQCSSTLSSQGMTSGANTIYPGLAELEPVPLPNAGIMSGRTAVKVSNLPVATTAQNRVPATCLPSWSTPVTAASNNNSNNNNNFVQQQPTQQARHTYMNRLGNVNLLSPQQLYGGQQQQEQQHYNNHEQDDSILAYVPANLLQNMGPPPDRRLVQDSMASNNNMSMTELPVGEMDRRSSITVTDLMRAGIKSGPSLNMDDLMDSFSKSKISNSSDEHRKLLASTDTMGTIEPITSEDMSFATMKSSTFSFLKGNESNFGGDMGDRSDFDKSVMLHNNPMSAGHYSYGNMSVGDVALRRSSDQSISIQDFWASRRKSSSFNLNLPGVSEEGGYRESTAFGRMPPVMDILENDNSTELDFDSMGASSLEMLKGMLMSNQEIDLPSDESPNQQRAQHKQPYSAAYSTGGGHLGKGR